MELLRLAPEEVFPSLSYAPPPASPGAPAWVHAAAARRDQARARLRLTFIVTSSLYRAELYVNPPACDRGAAGRSHVRWHRGIQNTDLYTRLQLRHMTLASLHRAQPHLCAMPGA